MTMIQNSKENMNKKKLYTVVWKLFPKVYPKIPLKRDMQITISLWLQHGSRSNCM